jgi:hypothetical protein
MSAFEDADAAFAACTPSLKFLKPPLLLFLFALFARGPAGGDRDALHPHPLGRRFVSGRKKSGIGRNRSRRAAELLHVLLQRGKQ